MLRLSPSGCTAIEAGKATPASPARAARHRHFGVCVLLFGATAAITVRACVAMSAMAAAPMPGGWAMSMMWTPMCGQTWAGLAACFAGMWSAMTVAMMLPVLAPALWSYRTALASAAATRADRLTVLAGLGYFAVWTACGIAVFALGAALTQTALHYAAFARAVPIAGGIAVVIAGAFQFSAWKARLLACCRALPECRRHAPTNAGAAWRHGLRLGLHCVGCCANLSAILLVVGAMDLRAMALVTIAIVAERLAADGAYAARVVGAAAIGMGLSLTVQAVLGAA